jgi:hypothetical protein
MLYRFLNNRNEVLDEKSDSIDIGVRGTTNFVEKKLEEKKLLGISGYEIISFNYKVGNNIPSTGIGISKNINGGPDGSANYIVTFPAGFYLQSEFVVQLQSTLNSIEVGNPIIISLDANTNKITISCVNPVEIYSAGGWSKNFMQLLGAKDTDIYNQNTTYTYPLPSINLTSSYLFVTSNFGALFQRNSAIFKYNYTKYDNYENVDIYKNQIIKFKNKVTIDQINIGLNFEGVGTNTLIVPEWDITFRFYL